MRRLAPVSAALLLAACASSPASLTTAGLATPTPESAREGNNGLQSTLAPGEARPRQALRITGRAPSAVEMAAASDASRDRDLSPAAALAKARGLRSAGDKAAALALLDKAARKAPDDATILTERGLLALQLGQIETARSLLQEAAKARPDDWRVHSGYGAALAAAGRHPQAQMAFARALELAPDHPAVLNNLALSYALDGRRKQAEALLRQAAGQRSGRAQARENLALLLGLDGRTEEARKVASAVLPAREAEENARYLASLVSPAPRGGQRTATKAVSGTPADDASAAKVYRLGGPRTD